MMSLGDILREYLPTIGIIFFIACIVIGVRGGKGGKGGNSGGNQN